MGKMQTHQPVGGGLTPEYFVLVQRCARPPLPWTWEVHRPGDPDASWRAVRGYRSAEDAWAAGQAALARLGVQRDGEPDGG